MAFDVGPPQAAAPAHSRAPGTRLRPSRPSSRRTNEQRTRSRASRRRNIERASFSTPRVPEGVMVQPSGRQFSSSQAVICVCRWPRPCGGTPILMRTGKRRSAVVIISRGLPGNLNVPYIFSSRLPRPLGAVQPVESALNRFGRESLFETKLSRRALPAQPSLPANVRQVAPSSDGHVV